jgi:hypothetical protein
MAKYTVEVTYYLPIYRHVTVEAETPEAAAIAAKAVVADSGRDGEEEDYDCSSPDFVTGIWPGETPRKSSLPIPDEHSAPNIPW